MKNLKYKALVHRGVFVEERLLEKGIYTATKPTLHNHEETIENLRDQLVEFHRFVGTYELDKALKNLALCEMQLIELSFV